MRAKVAAGPPLNLREAEVKKAVTDMLKRLGWVGYSTSDGRVSRLTPGFPDSWWMHPAGRPPFFYEAKSETGSLSTEQQRFQALCDLSGVAYVWGGTAQVLAHLKKIGVLA